MKLRGKCYNKLLKSAALRGMRNVLCHDSKTQGLAKVLTTQLIQ